MRDAIALEGPEQRHPAGCPTGLREVYPPPPAPGKEENAKNAAARAVAVPHTWRPERDAVELYVRGLKGWEPLGFEKGADGLVAVAGSEKIKLEEGHYCWHVTPDTELRGVRLLRYETAQGTLYVITLPIGAAIWVCAIPLMLLLCPFAVLMS